MCDNNTVESYINEPIDGEYRNVHLGGAGGVGKTYLIKNAIKKTMAKRTVAFACPTGTAAVNLSDDEIVARTLNSYFRIPPIMLPKHPSESPLWKISDDEERKELIADWRIKKDQVVNEVSHGCIKNKRPKNPDVLVIDEVSMVSDSMFRVINAILKANATTNIKKAKPFGGVQVITLGDFKQFAPIGDEYAFVSKVWRDLNFKMFKFDINRRYDCQDTFDLFSRLRMGEPTEKDIELLNTRYDAWIELFKKGGDAIYEPTRLMCYNRDVDAYNKTQLEKLDTFNFNFKSNMKIEHTHTGLDNTARDVGHCAFLADRQKVFNRKNENDAAKHLKTLVPEEIDLKENAVVMCRANLDPEKGIVNGAICTIVKIGDTLDDEKRLFMSHQCKKDEMKIEVRVHSTGELYILEPHTFQHKTSEYTAWYTQIPVILGWAMTIDKSQGMTLKKVAIKLDPKWPRPGRSYVACSRCVSLDGLYFTNPITRKMFVSPDIPTEFC